MRRYELTDAEWARVEQYFTKREAGQLGRPRNDDRQMLNGIVWVLRSGAPWRDVPERYGAWGTVYARFAQWQEEGLWEKILAELQKAADPKEMSLDSTSAKAHQHSAGAKKGL